MANSPGSRDVRAVDLINAQRNSLCILICLIAFSLITPCVACYAFHGFGNETDTFCSLIATSSEGIEAYSSELASGSADVLAVHPKTTASGTTATTTSATTMTTATKTPSPASDDRAANNGTSSSGGNGAAPTRCLLQYHCSAISGFSLVRSFRLVRICEP